MRLNGTHNIFWILLQDVDLADVQKLLLDCYEYYHSFKLSNDCVNKKCQVPAECQQHNAVYNIIHFLADSDFIKVKLIIPFVWIKLIRMAIAGIESASHQQYDLLADR